MAYNKEQRKKYLQKNKEVIKKKTREYQQKNKEKAKECRYKRWYNITFEEVDQLLIAQNHKCALCGRSLIETKRCIDHDHKTGKTRGILCDTCNFGLGHFHDDPELLKKAITYLETK